jgi:uncharacterized membrane protein
MKQIGKKIFSRFLGASFFSPGGFFSYAVIITITHFLLEAIGLRSYTAILFGMGSVAASSGWLAISLAGIYLFFYFAFVLLAPIFLLSSIFFLFILKVFKDHARL